LARELIILPRFKRDYRTARKHPEFDAETLEYVFDFMISGGKLPDALGEHRRERQSAAQQGDAAGCQNNRESNPPASATKLSA
jgi:hypothetical protein